MEDRSRLNGGHIFESEGDMSFDATVASRMKMALRETASMITVTAVLGERETKGCSSASKFYDIAC